MEFTKEAWENAPEGATLRYVNTISGKDEPVYLIGFKTTGYPVIEYKNGPVDSAHPANLRIILPKRKVKVQLWRNNLTRETALRHEGHPWPVSDDYTLLGEHTFEIEEG